MTRREPKNIFARVSKREIHLRCVCSEEEAGRIRERARRERKSVSRLLLDLADPVERI